MVGSRSSPKNWIPGATMQSSRAHPSRKDVERRLDSPNECDAGCAPSLSARGPAHLTRPGCGFAAWRASTEECARVAGGAGEKRVLLPPRRPHLVSVAGPWGGGPPGRRESLVPPEARRGDGLQTRSGPVFRSVGGHG